MRKAKYIAEYIILVALFIIYLIVLSKLTIFRGSNSGAQNVNLIPFFTISKYCRSILRGNKLTGISNIFGNLIIFFPLGYMPALLFPKVRKLTKILLLAFIFSLAIEALQYVFACGATDIDDVILNVLGGVVGYLVYALIAKFLEPKKYAIFISTLMIAFTCTGFLFSNNHKKIITGDVRETSLRCELKDQNHGGGGKLFSTAKKFPPSPTPPPSFKNAGHRRFTMSYTVVSFPLFDNCGLRKMGSRGRAPKVLSLSLPHNSAVASSYTGLR